MYSENEYFFFGGKVMNKIKFNEIIILLIGCFFMAISINMFLNPHNIAPGGLTGVSIIINTLTGFPIWLINIIFDIPLFLFAFRILGKKDATKTLLGIIFLTASLKMYFYLLSPVVSYLE